MKPTKSKFSDDFVLIRLADDFVVAAGSVWVNVGSPRRLSGESFSLIREGDSVIVGAAINDDDAWTTGKIVGIEKAQMDELSFRTTLTAYQITRREVYGAKIAQKIAKVGDASSATINTERKKLIFLLLAAGFSEGDVSRLLSGKASKAKG